MEVDRFFDQQATTASSDCRKEAIAKFAYSDAATASRQHGSGIENVRAWDIQVHRQ